MSFAHTIKTGAVFNAFVLPNTSFVIRDSRAYWGEHGNGVRGRIDTNPAPEPSIIVGHWTAGAPHAGPDTARRVVRNMRSRGIRVAIHFVIGSDGMVFQTADLADACVHVGDRDINSRSIGVEICSPGTEYQALRLGLSPTVIPRTVAGRRVHAVAFTDAQLASWTRLCEALATAFGIPRVVPPDAERMTKAQSRKYRGAMEHLHVPGTTKVDAGGMLVDALAAKGWSRG